jgi:hypothetical protein
MMIALPLRGIVAAGRLSTKNPVKRFSRAKMIALEDKTIILAVALRL